MNVGRESEGEVTGVDIFELDASLESKMLRASADIEPSFAGAAEAESTSVRVYRGASLAAVSRIEGNNILVLTVWYSGK